MAMMIPVALEAMGASAATAATVGTIANVASGVGTVMSLMGASSQADNLRRTAQQNAENARIAAEANKAQTDYLAGQSEAAGQHKAEEDRRKATLMLSRAQAVAAASGGGPLDENLAAGLLGQGEKQAGYTMYNAGEQAAGLRHKGNVGVYEANAQGRSNIESANKMADATLLGAYGKAGVSMFSRFAPGPVPGGMGDRGVSAAIDSGLWEY